MNFGDGSGVMCEAQLLDELKRQGFAGFPLDGVIFSFCKLSEL